MIKSFIQLKQININFFIFNFLWKLMKTLKEFFSFLSQNLTHFVWLIRAISKMSRTSCRSGELLTHSDVNRNASQFAFLVAQQLPRHHLAAIILRIFISFLLMCGKRKTFKLRDCANWDKKLRISLKCEELRVS